MCGKQRKCGGSCERASRNDADGNLFSEELPQPKALATFPARADVRRDNKVTLSDRPADDVHAEFGS